MTRLQQICDDLSAEKIDGLLPSNTEALLRVAQIKDYRVVFNFAALTFYELSELEAELIDMYNKAPMDKTIRHAIELCQYNRPSTL